jgi:hypothetical protein
MAEVKEVTSLFEAVDTLQQGMDSTEAAKCFKEGTRNYEVNEQVGKESLQATLKFLLKVKHDMGNFTLAEYVK